MSRRDDGQDLFGFKSVGDLVSKVAPKRPSRIQQRLIDTSAEISLSPAEQITYQHTVLCQTGLPYRNPGEAVRKWTRRNGRAVLQIEAGSAINPEKNDFVELPLPFGPKARLILIHLNAEAIRTGNPVIEVEDSMTAFVKRLLRNDPNGREIRTFKDQLAALSASIIRLAVTDGERAFQVDTKVVTAFDLWFPRNPNQRILWPSTVRLSQDYFDSLAKHAVPLDERAVAALAHSAMGLDIYAWLVQRLHRVPEGKPQFLPWTALKEQYGQGYGRMDNFRRVFLKALKAVQSQYPAARIEADRKGLLLRNSAPPVSQRLVLVSNRSRS